MNGGLLACAKAMSYCKRQTYIRRAQKGGGGRWDAGGLFLSAAKKAEYPGVGENNEREMRRRATDLSSVFFRY